MKVTVGVWGCGVVGSNTARMFEEFTNEIEILRYDKFKKGDWSSTNEMIERSDFIFLCLPSPMQDEDGSVDLFYIDIALKEISLQLKRGTFKTIIIRSTVVPGSCDNFAKKYKNLSIVHMPEFLVESDPWKAILECEKVIIGADNYQAFFSIYKLMYEVYKDKIRYVYLTRKEAEMYKYACNTLLTMNVLVANEIYNICQCLDISYRSIQRYLKFDSRLCTHTLVPGPDGDFGVGGKCLPKDVNALCHCAEQNGYTPELIRKGLQFNNIIRNNKDWLIIPGAVSSCDFIDEDKK